MSTHCVTYVELQQYTICEVYVILVTMALTTDKVSCMGISLTSTSDIRSLDLRQLVARVSRLTPLLLGSYSRARVRSLNQAGITESGTISVV